MMRLFVVLCFWVMVLPLSAAARPVSYADGWMAITMNDHMQYSNMLHYSVSAQDAFGARVDYLRAEGSWLHTATYNHLLQRWNAADSQGNLFLLTGLGVAALDGDRDLATTLGLAADWETRRLYVSYENRYIYAGDIEHSFTHKARVGIAPYVGGYEDIHSWLMLQVEHLPSERETIVVTPMLRLFTQQVMGEIGLSHRGDVMFNARLQF